MTTTTIRLSVETKARLHSAKKHKRETYEDVILASLHGAIFVRHIERELKEMFPEENAEVMCKICGKTLKRIVEEETEE